MRLSIGDGRLKVRLSLLEKVLSVRGSLEIPLDSIARAHTTTPRSAWWDIRAPGTCLPWVIRAGTYFTRRGREFWYVTRNRHFLIIELREGFYERIILSFDDNECWADRINRL